jgi:hypothetical protein
MIGLVLFLPIFFAIALICVKRFGPLADQAIIQSPDNA